MLYNILPPLFFFLSFAGIILVVSRVVMRVKRQEFSHAIKMEAQNNAPISTEHILNPGKAGVHLLKNRLTVLWQAAVRTSRDLKDMWQQRQANRAAKKATTAAAKNTDPSAAETTPSGRSLSMPKLRLKDKATDLVQGAMGAFTATVKKVQDRAKVRFEEAKITSVTLEPAQPAIEQTITPTKITNQIKISRVVKEEVKPPVSQAAPVVANKPEAKPEGRFIGRLRKATGPQPTALQQAQDAIASAHYDQAEEILVPYIISHAKDVSAYMLLGKVAMARGTWDEAFEIFQQVVQIDPTADEAQACLGHAALQQGKFTIALRALQLAHKNDPDNSEILRQILDIAKRMDNRILKKSVLQQLTELEPDNQTYAQDLQYLLAREATRAF